MTGKNSANVVRIFLVYTAFVGDVEKTAAALHLAPEFVRKLAQDEGWNAQLKQVCLMSKSGKPGDFERAQNRALCFVQAHQTRNLIDRVLATFGEMTEAEILEAVSSVAKDGSRHVSGRFFADLTAAMQKTHEMAYAALGDGAGERLKREDGQGEEMNATALHAAVLAALNNPKVKTIDVVAELETGVAGNLKQLAEPPPPSVSEPPASSQS
jgi:hypothetical protein